MFKPHLGYCKFCEQNEKLIVVKIGRCDKCNYDYKQQKKKAAGKKTGKYVFKREPTGEAQLFEDIAEKRDWICFVTGERLNELTPTQFLHVLPKALNKYPKFKLYEKNIVLASNDTHFKWDHTPRSKLRKNPLFDKLFALEEELKEEYKTVTKL